MCKCVAAIASGAEQAIGAENTLCYRSCCAFPAAVQQSRLCYDRISGIYTLLCLFFHSFAQEISPSMEPVCTYSVAYSKEAIWINFVDSAFVFALPLIVVVVVNVGGEACFHRQCSPECFR